MVARDAGQVQHPRGKLGTDRGVAAKATANIRLLVGIICVAPFLTAENAAELPRHGRAGALGIGSIVNRSASLDY